MAQWYTVRAFDLFCLQPLISLLADCRFFVGTAGFFPFSLIVIFNLGIVFSSYFLSCFFPLLISNAIQLLSCSPLCKNFHFLVKQCPGSHLLHVCRRETVFCTAQTLFFHHRDSCCAITLDSTMPLSLSSGGYWTGIFISFFGGVPRQQLQLKQDKNRTMNCPGSVPLPLSPWGSATSLAQSCFWVCGLVKWIFTVEVHRQ